MFNVPAVDLGRLKKVNIRHDNSGMGAAWYLDHVSVEDPQTEKTYVCIYYMNTTS